MDPKDRIGYAVGFVILICIGLWAVVDPMALEGYTAVGRRAGMKALLASWWGRPLGFTLVALGALALIGLFQSND